MEQKLYGGIEFGGTKTICAVSDANGKILSTIKIPTTSVHETFASIDEFFADYPIAALGVATFGPLNLDQNSPEFGYIYDTPKAGWEKVDIKGLLEKRLNVPVTIDTDVNGAALGELHFGAGREVKSLLYIGVGTGVGAGIIIDGKIHHGILNTEVGHIRVPHEDFGDDFQGICPYHKDCLEGIASGPAIKARYGAPAEQITDPLVWQREAQYIAYAIDDCMLSLDPELIVLGGGVMLHLGLIELIREEVANDINGYQPFPDPESYIVAASSNDIGVQGALKLAIDQK